MALTRDPKIDLLGALSLRLIPSSSSDFLVSRLPIFLLSGLGPSSRAMSHSSESVCPKVGPLLSP